MGMLKKMFKKIKSVVRNVDKDDISCGLKKLADVTSGQIKLVEIIDKSIKENLGEGFDIIQEKVYNKTGLLIPEESKAIVEKMISKVLTEGKNTKLGSLKKIFVEEVVPPLIRITGGLIKAILPSLIENLLKKI